MKKRKYTTKIHAERLSRMMKKKSPCGFCPAVPYFNDGQNPEDFWNSDIIDICTICREFIGLADTSVFFDKCPCRVLNPEEALKKTHKALKKWERAAKRKEE